MTSPRRVTLDELDAHGAIEELTDAEATAVERTGLVQVRPQSPGRWRLSPAGYVGAVRTADVEVQVLPKNKVGLDRVLFLLGYAQNPDSGQMT